MIRRFAFMISGLLLVSLFACSKSGKEEPQPQTQPAAAEQPAPQQTPTQAQPAEPASKPEPAPAETAKAAPRRSATPRTATPAAASKAAEPAGGGIPAVTPAAPASAAARQAAEVPAAPRPQTIWVPGGTRFEVRLVDPISTADNKTGDTFKAELDKDLEVDGKVVIPHGSIVTGKLNDVTQSGRVKGLAAMTITLTQITVGQTAYPIKTNTLSFEAEKTTKQDATKVGIGAGVGALIGAIAGGGKGAAIGAAVGGGAGTATVLATKGKDVKFAPEERFSFVLRDDLGIKF